MRTLRYAAGIVLLVSPIALARAQGTVISGAVTQLGSSTPVPATVTIQTLGLGAVANDQGRYTLQVPEGRARGQTVQITAKSIGYQPVTTTITLSAAPQTVNFELKSDPFRLTEVVTTGTADGQAANKLPFSVAVVNGDQLRDVPASSPIAALAGKVAGARIALGTGNPGAAPTIRLRGSTNLGVGGSSPLIIVDGVLTRFSIADLDAQDIETIEVLKGAAASAFYGSDAANGVISIATKRGKDLKDGQTRVSVRSEFGSSSVGHFVPLNQYHNYLLNADGSINETAAGARTLDGVVADNLYPTSGDGRYRNQLKEWLGTGQFYSTNAQVGYRRSGTNLNSSFTTDHNAGVLPFRSGQFRQSARLNVDQQISSKIDLGTSFTYSINRNDYDPNDSQGWFALLQSPPDINLTSPNGPTDPIPYNPVLPAWAANARGNPLYGLKNSSLAIRRERLLGSANVRYKPVDWLRVEGSYGTDRSNTGSDGYNPKGFLNGSGVPTDGSLALNRGVNVAENLQSNVIATKLFFNDLKSTSRVTYLLEKQTQNSVSASGSQFTVLGVPDLDAIDPANNRVGSSLTVSNAQNYFVSQAFDFKDKYVADFLVRRDASSLFGAATRWSSFYRVSGSWRFNEDLHIPGIQEGRIRASRGTAGIRPGFTDQYETYSVDQGLISKNQLGNPNLKPATQTEDEYGLNVTFLDRFDAELVYAARSTKDAFLPVPLSLAQSGGFKTQVQNAATIGAKTWEFSLQTRLLDSRNLSYSVGVTGDRTTQRIDKLGRAPFRVNAGGQNQNVFYYKEGEALGIIYGKQWMKSLAQTTAQGLDANLYVVNSDGYVVLKSQLGTNNEKPVAVVTNGSDQQVIGDVNPDFNFGVTQNLRFRNLSVYALIDGVKGGDIYNFTKQWMYQDGRHGTEGQGDRPEADRRPLAFYSGGLYDGLNANSHFVENGGYARLRELSVAYQFTPTLLRKVGMGRLAQGFKLSVVGRNLVTWTKYTGFDPEATSGGDFNFRIDGFRYPNFRTFTAMFDISF
ncbi:MAG: SusC/RagA family TonB-linked outer membrane protein [Gemmatimonas sp.]